MGSDRESVRREIAALTARMIADSGLDYSEAKAKAARQLFGARPPRDALPDNDEIDAALREHLELFDEHHDRRVRRMREVALDLMGHLEHFQPLVTGAAWKGVAAEHAPIHLQLFHDNAKEVEYWLLERHLPFEVGTLPHFRRPDEVEALAFTWQGQPVLLTLYGLDDQRGALRSAGRPPDRGDRAALAARAEAGS